MPSDAEHSEHSEWEECSDEEQQSCREDEVNLQLYLDANAEQITMINTKVDDRFEQSQKELATQQKTINTLQQKLQILEQRQFQFSNVAKLQIQKLHRDNKQLQFQVQLQQEMLAQLLPVPVASQHTVV